MPNYLKIVYEIKLHRKHVFAAVVVHVNNICNKKQ